jgi:hypothetical protein
MEHLLAERLARGCEVFIDDSLAYGKTKSQHEVGSKVTTSKTAVHILSAMFSCRMRCRSGTI